MQQLLAAVVAAQGSCRGGETRNLMNDDCCGERERDLLCVSHSNQNYLSAA